MSDYLGGVINGINDKTEEAFKYLYNTFYASLCRYANRFVGEFMDEEDVVQEIFVKLWEREGKFENMRAVSAYLYRSVHNGLSGIYSGSKGKTAGRTYSAFGRSDDI